MRLKENSRELATVAAPLQDVNDCATPVTVEHKKEEKQAIQEAQEQELMFASNQLIVMKVLKQRRKQVIRIKVVKKASIMQLFIILTLCAFYLNQASCISSNHSDSQQQSNSTLLETTPTTTATSEVVVTVSSTPQDQDSWPPSSPSVSKGQINNFRTSEGPATVPSVDLATTIDGSLVEIPEAITKNAGEDGQRGPASSTILAVQPGATETTTHASVASSTTSANTMRPASQSSSEQDTYEDPVTTQVTPTFSPLEPVSEADGSSVGEMPGLSASIRPQLAIASNRGSDATTISSFNINDDDDNLVITNEYQDTDLVNTISSISDNKLAAESSDFESTKTLLSPSGSGFSSQDKGSAIDQEDGDRTNLIESPNVVTSDAATPSTTQIPSSVGADHSLSPQTDSVFHNTVGMTGLDVELHRLANNGQPAEGNKSPTSAQKLEMPPSQLVRSRKSSPENKALTNSSSASGNFTHSSPANGITSASSLADASSGHNQTASTVSSNQPASTPDYDDFDLDYPLKMTDLTSTHAGEGQQGLNKRDYDNNQHEPTAPPPWSALINANGGHPAHLFKSAVSNIKHSDDINNSNNNSSSVVGGQASSATGNDTQQQYSFNRYYHNAPPMMPSLLTVKSAQLTSQELNKVRPHFLFYSDQYNDFNEPSPYGGVNGLEPANGDLIATATSLNEHKQRLIDQQQQQQHQHEQDASAAPRGFYEANGTSSFSPPPLSPVDSTLQLLTNKTFAAGPVTNQTSGSVNDSFRLSATVGDNQQQQVISLYNGSPINAASNSKQSSSLHDSFGALTQLATNRYQPTNGSSLSLFHANDIRTSNGNSNNSFQNQTSSPMHKYSDLSPRVTTIVVDNLTPTEAPPPESRAMQARQQTTHGPSWSPTSEQTTQPTASTSTAATMMGAYANGASQANNQQVSANLSQSHQWFNYPRPNLHQNPLLLHHILNKPSSFYAQNTGPVQQRQQQQQYQSTEQPTIVRTSTAQPPTVDRPTTIGSVMPLILTTSTSAPRFDGQTSSTTTTSAGSSDAINTMKRPTFSESPNQQQQQQQQMLQSVNMTMLQMQLDEMRKIAAKSSNLSDAKNHEELVANMLQNALLQQQQQQFLAQSNGAAQSRNSLRPLPTINSNSLPIRNDGDKLQTLLQLPSRSQASQHEQVSNAKYNPSNVLHSPNGQQQQQQLRNQQRPSGNHNMQRQQIPAALSDMLQQQQQQQQQAQPKQLQHQQLLAALVGQLQAQVQPTRPVPISSISNNFKFPPERSFKTLAHNHHQSTPLASQFIAAPSLLQEVFTPTTTTAHHRPQAMQASVQQLDFKGPIGTQLGGGQQQQQQTGALETLSTSASGTDNSTVSLLSDEDMSTYVALLASLHGPAQLSGKGKGQTGDGQQKTTTATELNEELEEGNNNNNETTISGAQEHEQLIQLLQALQGSADQAGKVGEQEASTGAEMHSQGLDLASNVQKALIRQHLARSKPSPSQQNQWQATGQLLRGAQLIGLAEERPGQRDHSDAWLRNGAGNSNDEHNNNNQQPAPKTASWQPLETTTNLNRQPSAGLHSTSGPMESSNELRSFSPPSLLMRPLGAPANLKHELQEDFLDSISSGSNSIGQNKNYYSLDGSSQLNNNDKAAREALQLQLHLQNQHRRQIAFIEALKSSLVQLHQGKGNDLNQQQHSLQQATGSGNSSQVALRKLKANSPAPIIGLKHEALPHNSDLEFDENIANSSSRPVPEWLDNKQQLASHQDSLQPHSELNLFRGISNLFPQSWLSAPHRPPAATSVAQSASFGQPVVSAPAPVPPAPTRLPIPVYPLRSLFNYGHKLPAASPRPQPRLLWPVQPISGPVLRPPVYAEASTSRLVLAANGGSAAAAAAQQQQQQQSQLTRPLAGVGPVSLMPPQSLSLQALPPSTQLGTGLRLQQPASWSLFPGPPAMTPATKIMLDRFPLTSAPAYLVKVPTLTGGTITASGALVGPQRLFARRPPAAFISATPLGALRFLNALAPPRMRLIHQTAATPGRLAAPPAAGGGGGLQSSQSMLHVHHSPLSLGGPSMPPPQPPSDHHYLHQAYWPAPAAPLYQSLPHLQQHQPHTDRFRSVQPLHPTTASSSVRLQWPYGGSGPVALQQQVSPHSHIGTSASSIVPAQESSSMQVAGASSSSQPSGHSDRPGAQDKHQVTSGQHRPAALSSSALARLQQATASLVELTSLASLLDEMLGGSDLDSSPALALANALNSLSAAHNAATLSAQASASGDSARIHPSSSSGGSGFSTNSPTIGQTQSMHAPASIWKNLFMPTSVWRNNNYNKLNGTNNANRFGGLERLLAHAALMGGGSDSSPRLKVKYIRVPVAVYENGAPNIGDSSLQLAALSAHNSHNLDNGNTASAISNAGTKLQHQSGAEHSVTSQSSVGITSSGASAELGSDTLVGGLSSAIGSTSSGVGAPSSPSPLSSPSSSSGQQQQALSSSAPGSSTASSSNDYLFDEMSSESGAQLNYMLNSINHAGHKQLEHQHGAFDLNPGLSYLPVVRAVPKLARLPVGMQMHQQHLAPEAPVDGYYALASASNSLPQQMATVNSFEEGDESEGAGAKKKKKTQSTKKKRRRNKKSKKNRGTSFLLGGIGDDDDSDDSNGEQSNSGPDGDGEEDDDALTEADLPIIESLISTIVHGAPSSAIRHHEPAGTAMYGADPMSAGWRPMGRQRNRLLSPEASTNVVTYAHPASGLAPLSAGGIVSVGTSGYRNHLLAPFNKQRFSLTEVVGALGAKRLISSLLNKHKGTRSGKRTTGAGTAASAAAAAAALAVTPATLTYMTGAGGGDARGNSGGTGEKSKLKLFQPHPRLSSNQSLASPLSFAKMRHGLANIGLTMNRANDKPAKANRNKQKRQRQQQHHNAKQNSSSSSSLAATNGKTMRPEGDNGGRFVLGDDLKPLGYPPIAAYESDSFQRRAKTSTTTTTTTKRPISDTDNRGQAPQYKRQGEPEASPLSLSPARLDFQAFYPGASAAVDKMSVLKTIERRQANLTHLGVDKTPVGPQAGLLKPQVQYEFVPKISQTLRAEKIAEKIAESGKTAPNKANELGKQQQQQQQQYYGHNRSESNARGPSPGLSETIVVLAPQSGGLSINSSRALDKATMPLYHVVADHYNKLNAGHQRLDS